MNWKDGFQKPKLITSVKGKKQYTDTITQGRRLEHCKSLLTMTLAKNVATNEIELLHCLLQPDAVDGVCPDPIIVHDGMQLKALLEIEEGYLKPLDMSPTLQTQHLADPEE